MVCDVVCVVVSVVVMRTLTLTLENDWKKGFGGTGVWKSTGWICLLWVDLPRREFASACPSVWKQHVRGDADDPYMWCRGNLRRVESAQSQEKPREKVSVLGGPNPANDISQGVKVFKVTA